MRHAVYVCVVLLNGGGKRGSYSAVAFHIQPIYGMAAMLLACAVVFLFDLKGILAVNAFLGADYGGITVCAWCIHVCIPRRCGVWKWNSIKAV